MNQPAFSPTLLSDYQPPNFALSELELRIELDRQLTRVTSRMQISRDQAGEFELMGRNIDLQWIRVNGESLGENDYELAAEGLTLKRAPAAFALEICSQVSTADNPEEMGLFESGDHLATECEPNGFSHFCFFPDRPDVMTTYRVTLVGDRSRYPVMLCNGNRVDQGEYADGRHWVIWEDPIPKPSYIFALFAGDFSQVRDTYTTGSGRDIELNIYIDADLADRCDHAMGALKRSLAWEERIYGLEYDLDIYNIVALTGHGNCMENKGLNLFPAEQIVACPETTTDQEYMVIERIIAHEMFHNWTGNRITCRDWFQLCLKEGLTRFRDRCYDQDLFMGSVKRIEEVKALRRNQFLADDGPAAHAVRPESYYTVENFYNSTVYDKGAEIIRMLHLLLGDEGFHEGFDLFVSRHDLEAVTVEQFLAAMTDATGKDLTQFSHWYSQVGRPRLKVDGRYNETEKTYTLNVTQRTLGKERDATPVHLPLAVGLLSREGRPLAFGLQGDTDRGSRESAVLEVTDSCQQFVLTDVADAPVPSLLRGFSAPVSVEMDLSDYDLGLLMSSDSDPYVRWDATQRLTIAEIRRLAASYSQGEPLRLSATIVPAFETVLRQSAADRALAGLLLDIADEPNLSEGLSTIELDPLMAGRDFLMQQLSQQLREPLLDTYHQCDSDRTWRYDEASIGRRMLKNACVKLLVVNGEQGMIDLCYRQLKESNNMTERFAAFTTLIDIPCPERDQAIDWTYQQWQSDRLVMGKWFKAQALSRAADTIERLQALTAHPAFDMGNTAYSMALFGTFFRQNRIAFHHASGAGYDWLADILLVVDKVRPGGTGWLMPQIAQWRRYDPQRREKMRKALSRVASAPGISKALYENISKLLE